AARQCAVIDLRGIVLAAEVNDGALTGRANVSWQATDNVLAYASYARGEKSGGINMSGLPLNDQNLPAIGTAVVRPEKNTAYEVGLKTRLFDNRLTFNIDAFYTRVTDFQTNVSLCRFFPAQVHQLDVVGRNTLDVCKGTADVPSAFSGIRP
ncbi:MAG: TonB-dependent receptor, partial [Oxalobacteraceae bacterium]